MTADPSPCLRWVDTPVTSGLIGWGCPQSRNLAASNPPTGKSREISFGVLCHASPVCYGAPCHRAALNKLTVADNEPVLHKFVNNSQNLGVVFGLAAFPQMEKVPPTPPSKVF